MLLGNNQAELYSLGRPETRIEPQHQKYKLANTEMHLRSTKHCSRIAVYIPVGSDK
jgi:hypothetical protein